MDRCWCFPQGVRRGDRCPLRQDLLEDMSAAAPQRVSAHEGQHRARQGESSRSSRGLACKRAQPLMSEEPLAPPSLGRPRREAVGKVLASAPLRCAPLGCASTTTGAKTGAKTGANEGGWGWRCTGVAASLWSLGFSLPALPPPRRRPAARCASTIRRSRPAHRSTKNRPSPPTCRSWRSSITSYALIPSSRATVSTPSSPSWRSVGHGMPPAPSSPLSCTPASSGTMGSLSRGRTCSAPGIASTALSPSICAATRARSGMKISRR